MDAVVIMAKAPEPNRVKTRLTPPLTPDEASHLYMGFLLDKMEQVQEIVEAHRIIAYTPGASEPFFRSLAQDTFRLIRQKGRDLGERLASAAEALFIEGYGKVVLLDSDTPHLPPDYILNGLKALDHSNIVIGPCDDGGYYLVGMERYIPELFCGIPWSTSAVAAMTIEKAKFLGWSVSTLDPWFDVDTIADLLRLKEDLENPGTPKKGQFPCLHTRNALVGIDLERL